jgi:hypothetical protein
VAKEPEPAVDFEADIQDIKANLDEKCTSQCHGVLFFAFLAWTKKYWTVYGRLHYSLILLSGLVFLWLLNFWNLLGWKF